MHLIIEFDAKAVTRMIKKEIDAEASLVFHDIWSLARCVRSEEFEFTLREGNRATHFVVAYVQKVGALLAGIVSVRNFFLS